MRRVLHVLKVWLFEIRKPSTNTRGEERERPKRKTVPQEVPHAVSTDGTCLESAPLKAGAWKGSRRYIICGDRGGCQTSRSVEDFCLHVRPERGLLPWPPFRRRLIKLVGMHIQLAGLNRF